MNTTTAPDAYGVITEPATMTLQRRLPGPIERVWAYLTDGELRGRWLAAGDMDLQVGAPFMLVWRNDELTDPPGARPEGFGAEHSMQSQITELDPPHRIAFTWDGTGDVSITLEPAGNEVLLTLVHRRLRDRSMSLMVGAGWHMHLDVLVARASRLEPEPFWDGWKRLKEEYDARIPA